MSVLVSWVGKTDLTAPSREADFWGPLGRAVKEETYDEVVVLCDFKSEEEEVKQYFLWLEAQTGVNARVLYFDLDHPLHFGQIFAAAESAVQEVFDRHGVDAQLTFHMSPGTPVMAAVWVILAKTRYAAQLISSSREIIEKVAAPFQLRAEFQPHRLEKRDLDLERLTSALPPEAPEFEDIIRGSQVMEMVVQQARLVAGRSVPVLIEGETGTGKELFARAIHRASQRRENPFVPINCGAIPENLVESELFGHDRGAFTGATSSHRGLFERAHSGTLFLDELGELPLAIQVKLLRVLETGLVTPVGSARTVSVDVRIVAATNRGLVQEVEEGRFREDLFYRLAVMVLRLPPLRERTGGLERLIRHTLARLNRDGADQPGIWPKELTQEASRLLCNHTWPGNMRELINTLTRATVFTMEEEITAEEVRLAMLQPTVATAKILDRPLIDGFSLDELLADVGRHYIARALEQTAGNKTDAARLIGIKSHQTLSNRMERYKML